MKSEINPESLTITLIPAPGHRFEHKAGENGFTKVQHNPDGSVTLLKAEWLAKLKGSIKP